MLLTGLDWLCQLARLPTRHASSETACLHTDVMLITMAHNDCSAIAVRSSTALVFCSNFTITGTAIFATFRQMDMPRCLGIGSEVDVH